MYARRRGNEANAKHHTDGKINKKGDTKDIRIVVPKGASSFPVRIVTTSPDRMAVSVRSPLGEEVPVVPEGPGVSFEAQLSESGCAVRIDYYYLLTGLGTKITGVSLINPEAGIWTITIHGDLIVYGVYHAWLPITGLVSPGVDFVNANPQYTIVAPGTAVGVITCRGI